MLRKIVSGQDQDKELVFQKVRASREQANPPALHAGNARSVTEVAYSDWSDALIFKKSIEQNIKKVDE